MRKRYIQLKDLEVYRLTRELSQIAWEIYQDLDWQDKKTMGDQFLTSTDSTGANIAEGYGRYHYLDQIKFYYNCRGSLNECCYHWLEILYERGKVKKEQYTRFKQIVEKLSLKLNNFITSTYKQKLTETNRNCLQ